MRRRNVAAGAAILIVLAAYVFFSSGGTFEYRAYPSHEYGLYPSLAEGFLRGQLNLPRHVPPELLALPHPYDFEARKDIDYLWDASYLNGRYYLYFSPLPALLIYMPYKLLVGEYSSDTLVATLFAVWAFLAAVAFTRRALAMMERPPRVPFALWILLLGLGTVVPFLLVEIRIYEVAILCGTAMTATWAWSLVRFMDKPSTRNAAWMAFWLAMSIAARPNMGVLLFVCAFVIWRSFAGRRERLRAFIAALVPLAVIGSIMIGYNVARFGDPLEFGQSYQLTFVPMADKSVCSLCTLPEAARFVNNVVHYVFWAPVVRSEFPFVDMAYSSLDPPTMFPMGAEEIVGAGALVPLTLLGTFCAFVFACSRRRLDRGTHVGVVVMAASWLILAGLATCWHVVSRYDMDFLLLMTAAAVVCVEAAFAVLESNDIRLTPARIGVALLACYSIVLGFLLGFVGQGDAFKRLRPELYQKMFEWF